MKKEIIKRIANLFKIKSIVTLTFLLITIFATFKSLDLPEWLVPIVTLCFKELFDKDKVKTIDNSESEDE